MAVQRSCDECGKTIEEYAQYVELIPVNTPSTFADPYIDRDLCSFVCVARYAAERCGMEVSVSAED